MNFLKLTLFKVIISLIFTPIGIVLYFYSFPVSSANAGWMGVALFLSFFDITFYPRFFLIFLICYFIACFVSYVINQKKSELPFR
ncbi:MAG: hypothetical protein A2946_01860 [Candidatus Liptonbacteria bacterium RIFCSPLOWO2_01_FULL_53_13]|uniref:Uncharacterized protein n=1 Tax=Candidatus Liptonbacteria bacterium RIFCSPLOWO2_01_FULL_53_13 TaxID=1798651 RepID=A0A1G2CMS0_9BACT|nr:MAG: hypothetical protein A2946_01860 [Candidatus Liptonbacteria bacterium RIFCSPLOWO2_01_FULL_53_13]